MHNMFHPNACAGLRRAMMKTTPILSIVFTALLASACGTAGSGHEDHDHGHNASTMESHEHDEHTSAAGGAVKLDNGNTWAANVETTDGIRSMQAILNDFDPATDDGTVLKEELEAEFNEIFAKCTMTGEAHDQLHNFLIPVHGMLDKFGSTSTDAQREELAKYLGTYGNYFH